MSIKLTNLNFDSLVQFHYVAHLQSLTKAAEHLGVSAPAVTHSLRKLEDSLGVILCTRSKAGFQLTEHGRQLFDRTKGIVHSIDSFLISLDRPKEFGGTLSIGMIDNLDSVIAQQALDAVTLEFPEIKLNILVTDAEEITAGVLAGEIDVGIGLFHKKHERLSYVELGKSTMRYFISDKHPLWKKKTLTKDHLVGHRVAWIESKKRKLADLDSKIFIPHPRYKMKVAAYSNHLDGALAILNSGFAVVPIPPSYIAKLANRVHIRELNINSNAPVFAEEAVYVRKKPQSPPVKFLVEYFMKHRK